jgi:O-antigen/teichoic acid export membrane protein
VKFKSILKNSSIVSSASLLAAAAQFLILPILVNAVGFSEFGIYSLIQVTVLLCTAVYNFELWVKNTPLITKSRGVIRKEWIKTGLVAEYVSFSLSLISFLTVWLIASKLGLVGVESYDWLLPCIFLIFFSESSVVMSVYRSSDSWKTIGLYMVLPSITK